MRERFAACLAALLLSCASSGVVYDPAPHCDPDLLRADYFADYRGGWFRRGIPPEQVARVIEAHRRCGSYLADSVERYRAREAAACDWLCKAGHVGAGFGFGVFVGLLILL